jgi:hypothetical protein
MVKDLETLFPKMVKKDLKQLVGLVFSETTQIKVPFTPLFDTSYQVFIQGPSHVGEIIFHFNFEFLSFMYQLVSQKNSEENRQEVEDLGQEIANIIGGKLLDLTQLPDTYLGIPQVFTQANKKQFVEATLFDCFQFHNKNGDLYIYLFLKEKENS